jgi:hypothetical protein
MNNEEKISEFIKNNLKFDVVDGLVVVVRLAGDIVGDHIGNHDGE